jgi:hypothetical protein
MTGAYDPLLLPASTHACAILAHSPQLHEAVGSGRLSVAVPLRKVNLLRVSIRVSGVDAEPCHELGSRVLDVTAALCLPISVANSTRSSLTFPRSLPRSRDPSNLDWPSRDRPGPSDPRHVGAF